MAKDRSLRRQKTSKENPLVFGKNYLLAIGIDTYASCPVLKNAVKDATDLAEVLETQYDFLPENIRLVINEEATEYRIFAEFRRLIQEVGPEDSVVIFFCGHGHFDEDFKQGYWIPVNAPAGEIGDYIPNSEISTTIRAIRSQHTFMIADACFSGSLFGESRSAIAKTSLSKYHKKVRTIPSRWGLASGRNEIVSDGSEGGNSPFSENLLFFLKTNTDAPFTVSDLVQYVKSATANNAEQTPIGSPLRNVGDKGGEYVFYPAGTNKEEEVAEAVTSSRFASASNTVYATDESDGGIVDPNAFGSTGMKFSRWIKSNYRMLLLLVCSAVFGGLWNAGLFWVVPALGVSLMAITALLHLEGIPKYITTAGITLLAMVEFSLYNRKYWTDIVTNDSVLDKTQNHEFLWFALGCCCFAGFLYFFLGRKSQK